MVARLGAWLTSAKGRLKIKLPRIEWLSRIASILLTAALALSTAFVLETASVTREVASRVDLVRTLTDHLHAAQYALEKEQSLEREYRLSPQGFTFVAHRTAANQLVTAMQAVRALSDSNGRGSVDRIIAAHRTYLSATRRMFVATNRADAGLVVTIQRDQVDPVFDVIDEAIDALASTQAVIADNAIAQLHRAQTRVIDITVTLSLIGIGCLICFLSILRTYRVRLEKSHELELQRLESTQDLLSEVSRAERHAETLTLALLDVDDFKVVNDRDGHIHGDHVLATLAHLLASLRAEDRAYRVGGDEFALILPHTSSDAAKLLVERLRVDVALALFGNTLSVGLASLSGSARDVETLQSQADAALYAAKRSGRNTVTAFDESLDGMWLLSPIKVNKLRQLIASRSINVVFQPIWDMQRCRILAYEALSRPDAAFGFQGPQDAFDLAERIGRAHESRPRKTGLSVEWSPCPPAERICPAIGARNAQTPTA